ANWMAACGAGEEDAHLHATVQAVSTFCQALGICIPVGKDSLSMNTVWQENGQKKQVTAPLSLIVSAFAPVVDVRQSLTPQLRTDLEETVLILIDLGRGKNRGGGSALMQVYNYTGGEAPDLERPEDLIVFFRAIQILNETGVLLAYHDRSDGGLFVTLCELAFAARAGLDIVLDNFGKDLLPLLFNEEAGAVIQVRAADADTVRDVFREAAGLNDHIHCIGTLNKKREINLHYRDKSVFNADVLALQRQWAETSYCLQSLRDHPECADEEYQQLLDQDDPGLTVHAGPDPVAPHIATGARPRMAILREQGVNGQVEMAAAFHRAGFDCIDVHMQDVITGAVSLKSFHGLAACGGFSYGDVLGAGGGWAKSILYNERARAEFESFFTRGDTFGLGVCNGCQMFSYLRQLIPGAEHWPDFVRNRSEQFEARLVMVEVLDSPSIMLRGMSGYRLPIVTAHGEGRTHYINEADVTAAPVCLRFIDNRGKPAEIYPANPNGSARGETGFTTKDGRFTIIMPHPERVFLRKQFSWFPPAWKHEESPWLQLFRNARMWLE
ncbi:MAG: phosphoribosylformylglycinamidine synthase, partial [Gammaproteobacteria bacterium]